jgi:hypothetical protein
MFADSDSLQEARKQINPRFPTHYLPRPSSSLVVMISPGTPIDLRVDEKSPYLLDQEVKIFGQFRRET